MVFGTALALAAGTAYPQGMRRRRGPQKLQKRDRCPVCGMFVKKYPKWVAQIIFKDGSYAVFDGAKDLFKYYFDVTYFDPQRSFDDIDEIYVTDYYSLELIEAKTAFYVIGSDVYGPMGHELIPHKDRASAEEFLTDHKGTRILTFEEVTTDVIKGLDKK
jgi:nitrous oxide reductase accessory protein NosL